MLRLRTVALPLLFLALSCRAPEGSPPARKPKPVKILTELQGQLLRLTPVVPVEQVRSSEIDRRLAKMHDWYLHNLAGTGEMTYQYRLAENTRSQANNNMIRQFMTTLALFRLSDYLGDRPLRAQAERNLAFNLTHYLRIDENKQIAYIYSDGKAKLGAAAFAMMALLESREYPERDKLIGFFKNFILTMQEKNGKFRTFYVPKGRDDNQNFYPGEAMLALMTLYQSDPRRYQDLLDPVSRAFSFYRLFFKRSPNPAFVPWHTMALYRLYQVTPNPELAQFIFEMNDFLIGIQNTPEAVKTPWPDAMGRFYDPARRHFGPPHASSTAVYTEGLVDAYRLAAQLGDKGRLEKYGYAIRWGLRSIFQLQYLDETAALLPDKKAALGGIRTTETNGDIRVDNTQHATMALLNVLGLPDRGEMIWTQVRE